MNTDCQLTIQAAITQGQDRLRQCTENPYNEVLILLQYITAKSKTLLIAYPDDVLTAEQLDFFEQALLRRDEGEPMAYIIAQREFWSLELKVQSGVLIPRPETELLVEACLPLLEHNRQAKILDLGTGSGCIALALAKEYPSTKIIACDISATCLEVAAHNAQVHQLTNIHFMRSHWFSAIDQMQFDLIVSNPPYIDENDPDIDPNVERFEPDLALFADQYGYADLFHIIENSCGYLTAGGTLLIEHGWQQAMRVRQHLTENGYTSIATSCDLQLHERVTQAQFR